jgi:outer membrane receptor protein involved in Fe transport
VGGALTWTWGEGEFVDSDTGETITEPLTRIPPLFTRIGLRYDTKRFETWQGYAETYVRAAAGQDRLSPNDERDVRIPEGGTPGWWTWNLAVGLDAWEHLSVGLRAENLLDRKYKYHGSGIYASGTNVLLTLRGYY